jgi:hypothetical protein
MKQRPVAVAVLAILGLSVVFAASAGASESKAGSHLPGTAPFVAWETTETAATHKFMACGYTTTEAEEARAHKSDPEALARIPQRYKRSVCVVRQFPASADLAPLAHRVNGCLGKHDQGQGVPLAIGKECMARSKPSSAPGR